MATLPLDLDGVMAELDGDEAGTAPTAPASATCTCRSSELPPTEAFYEGGLGLDVTTARYPGALFLSAGGYHHHIGTNTWASAARRRPRRARAGSAATRSSCRTRAELERVSRQLRATGHELAEVDGGVEAVDPSGNRALLTAGPAGA